MNKKVVMVCGSRSISNFSKIFRCIEEALSYWGLSKDQIIILHGGARGVDSIAGYWAKKNNIPVEVIKPDWKRYGKRAGFIRNSWLVNKADYVIAIWDSKSRGTIDSVIKAKDQRKPVKLFTLGKNNIS